MRVWHRRAARSLFVGAFPVGALALATFTQVAGVNIPAQPASARLAHVLLLIAVAATVGGAWSAWIFSGSATQPFRVLEFATARSIAGHLNTRVAVNATDEFGALAKGFNLAAVRLKKTFADLEPRNRERAKALNRVVFLEHVKRGLDRFVPDTICRATERNPEAPGLGKQTKDVRVLFRTSPVGTPMH